MSINPTEALFGAIAAPFATRWAVAWTVELRLRGFVYGANLEPRRLRADYPSPNDPIRSFLVFVLVAGIGWPIATILSSLLSPAMADAAFCVSAIPSFAYWFLRVRADDRRTRDLLAARLAREVTSPHPD